MKVIFHFKFRGLATLKFKDTLTENKKKKTFTWPWKTVKEKQG